MTSPRRLSRLAALASVGVLLVLPGCLEAKNQLTLQADGSGTATVRVEFDEGKMQQILEMVAGMMGGGQGGMDDGGTESGPKKQYEDRLSIDKLKKQLEGKKGVELVSATPINDLEKKKRGYEVKLKFESLEAFFRAGVLPDTFARLEDLGGGTYRLTFANTLFTGGRDTMEVDETALAQFEMGKGAFGALLDGFDFSTTFSLPTPASETNGTKDTAGTSVSWSLKLDDMADPKKTRHTATFKGEGANWKPFYVSTSRDGVVTDLKPAAPVKQPADEPAKPAEPVPAK